jgi:hypothetical protein
MDRFVSIVHISGNLLYKLCFLYIFGPLYVWYNNDCCCCHYYYYYCEQGRLSRYSNGLDELGSTPGRGKGLFSIPQRPDKLLGPPSLLFNGYEGPFPQG